MVFFWAQSGSLRSTAEIYCGAVAIFYYSLMTWRLLSHVNSFFLLMNFRVAEHNIQLELRLVNLGVSVHFQISPKCLVPIGLLVNSLFSYHLAGVSTGALNGWWAEILPKISNGEKVACQQGAW